MADSIIDGVETPKKSHQTSLPVRTADTAIIKGLQSEKLGGAIPSAATVSSKDASNASAVDGHEVSWSCDHVLRGSQLIDSLLVNGYSS